MAGIYADSAQRLSSAFRRGFSASSGLDSPGATLASPQPFRPGTVTGSGIVLKALTQLMVGRRAAANARQAADQRASNQQYRDLTIQKLQQDLSQPTRELDVPGTSLKVKATDRDVMTHPGAFRSPAGAAPVHVPKDYAAELGIPYEETSGTVSPADLRANVPRLIQRAIEMRSKRGASQRERFHEDSMANFKTREGRALGVSELTAHTKIEKDLDAEEHRQADDYAAQAQVAHEAAARILQNPSQSSDQRAKAARMLRVPLLRDPNTGALVKDPATGRLMYDVSKLPGQVKAATDAARQRRLTQARNANAATRLYYSSRSREIARGLAGDDPASEGPDPVIEALAPLFKLYPPAEPQPAESDTSEGGLDQPAY